MAIINSYPKVTPKGDDLLIGTQVADDNIAENSTKSFSVSAIGSFLITSNDVVTGSGTTNTLPVWTDGPNGVLGDSMITQNSSGNIANVAGRLSVDTDLSVTGYARFSGEVQDSSNSPGTSGQVLTSTGTATTWESLSSISEIKSEKVIVSTAELKDLHNTPKILVDVTSGNPKELCQVYSVIFSVGGNSATDNLIFPNDITIQSNNVNPWKYIIPQATANSQLVPYYVPSLTAGLSGLDSDVVLSSAGAAVETGTATTTMTVWITYRIFEIDTQ